MKYAHAQIYTQSQRNPLIAHTHILPFVELEKTSYFSLFFILLFGTHNFCVFTTHNSNTLFILLSVIFFFLFHFALFTRAVLFFCVFLCPSPYNPSAQSYGKKIRNISYIKVYQSQRNLLNSTKCDTFTYCECSFFLSVILYITNSTI